MKKPDWWQEDLVVDAVEGLTAETWVPEGDLGDVQSFGIPWGFAVVVGSAGGGFVDVDETEGAFADVDDAGSVVAGVDADDGFVEVGDAAAVAWAFHVVAAAFAKKADDYGDDDGEARNVRSEKMVSKEMAVKMERKMLVVVVVDADDAFDVGFVAVAECYEYGNCKNQDDLGLVCCDRKIQLRVLYHHLRDLL